MKLVWEMGLSYRLNQSRLFNRAHALPSNSSCTMIPLPLYYSYITPIHTPATTTFFSFADTLLLRLAQVLMLLLPEHVCCFNQSARKWSLPSRKLPAEGGAIIGVDSGPMVTPNSSKMLNSWQREAQNSHLRDILGSFVFILWGDANHWNESCIKGVLVCLFYDISCACIHWI